MIAYLTDVEGRWDKLATFCEGNPHVSLVDGRLVLGDGVTFVFGGDAIDRGPADRRFVALLVAAKRSYGDRVVLLAGNRDINKLRLVYELGGKPHRRAPPGMSRSELLRWTLANTMGAGKAFDHRLTALRDAGLPATDDDVVATYLDDLAPGGDLRAYLDACQLGFRDGATLILHGGVTPENFLRTPGADVATSIDDWLVKLARFYRDEMDTFVRGTRPDALIAYQAQGPDKLNQGSVVYARPTDEEGNPHLPPRDIVERLLAEGIRRVVVGHTPSGDCPAILRDGEFELVLADNSYGRIERGSQVAIDSAVAVAAMTQLDDGSQHAVRYASNGVPLGMRIAGTGQLVKAQLASGEYLLFRGLPQYKVEQIAAPVTALRALELAR